MPKIPKPFTNFVSHIPRSAKIRQQMLQDGKELGCPEFGPGYPDSLAGES